MFNAADLAHMRETQTNHMLDLCVIVSVAPGTANEFNEFDNPQETEIPGIPCGLDMRPNSERHGQNQTVIQYDATLRLPIGTLVKETNRIRIVARFGEPIEGLTYEIVSPVQRGPSGIRLVLRKIVV